MGATLRSGDMTLTVPPDDPRDNNSLLAKEWLVTNGLGGYVVGDATGCVYETLPRHVRARLGVSLGPHGHHSATR